MFYFQKHTAHNSVGALLNCLSQPGQLLKRPTKTMRLN